MKERALNMELLRIIAMIMVVIVHINFGLVGGTPIFEKGQILQSCTRCAIQSLCIICVNSFVLISGWYGIKPSSIKFTGFLFQILFWTIFSACIASLHGKFSFSIQTTLSILCLDGELWFITSYIILWIISPILNLYIEKENKKQIQRTLLNFFILQTLFDWGCKIGYYAGGFSPLSFIGLYLLARYVHKYPSKYSTLHPKYDLLIYITCSILTTIIIVYFAIYGEFIERIYFYSSPLVIISSLYFVLFFSKITIHRFKKTILYFSTSSFAVYLFHDNELIRPLFRYCRDFIYNNYGIIGLIGCVLLLFIAVTTIDKLRILIWKSITSSKNKVYQP